MPNMAAAHHSNRPSAYSKRPPPPHSRPSRPTSSSKRTHSYVVTKPGSKATQYKEEDFEDEDSMATSFLQYCTTCEKQIIVPNNSVLYCSESCRKKDNEKAIPYSLEYSPPMSPFSSFYADDMHFRDIVARRPPTAPPSKRSSMVVSEMSSDDSVPFGDERPRPVRTESEASKYLRQFQSATAAVEPYVRPDRPRYSRASTASQATSSAAPSLSDTPASSISYSMPYTPSTRPLPPRTNPHVSSYGSRSIELVTPFSVGTTASSPPQYSLKSNAVSKTSPGTVEGEILYEKRTPLPPVATVPGSLKSLFDSTPRWA